MPLLSVYNNLIQGHVMMRQTRFDSHKRDELKAIHHRIRRINADKPFYKITFDEDTQEYALGVKEKALALADALKELSSDDASGVFSKHILVSDQPESVAVQTVDGFDPTGFEALAVSVTELSISQRNEGHYVSIGETELVTGQYNFTIGVEDNLYSFQFIVQKGSTNKELQTKLSDFINKSNIGLRTNVSIMKESGRSRMDIWAKENGVPFKLRDTRMPDNTYLGIVRHFGLDNVVMEAKKTTAYINGEEIVTAAHEYVMDSGLQLNFLDATKETPAIISSVVADAPVIAQINEFIHKYNDFMAYISVGAGVHKASRKLIMEMNLMSGNISDVLRENGIMIMPDGTISMDRELIQKSIRSGNMEQLFKNNGAVTDKMIERFGDITLNPLDFIDKTIITYPNTQVKNPFNPYVNSAYSGLMYNNYC